MSTFNDQWNDHAPRASVTVHTDTPEAKVTYRGDNGAKFRVIRSARGIASSLV